MLMAMACAGSSPRVRGKVFTRQMAPAAIGIIPAGAGKSEWFGDRAVGDADHPRGCGEK